MKAENQLGVYGALLLAFCLIGYASYELILYPQAGFPTRDFAVIVAGADTLRVGHWLKFGYALSIALLMTSMQPRLQRASATLAQLGLLAGASAIVLFLASGHIGLHILATAEETFATRPDEAITTILLRTVTIALFEAAGFAVGWYLVLSSIGGIRFAILPRLLSWVGCGIGILFVVGRFLSDEVALIAPLAQVAMPLHAQSEPVVSGAGPAATQAGYTIKVNTLVDEWSTDINTKAKSKCSLRETLQATITNNPEGNQGCRAPSIANFEEYSIDLLSGTYLLTRKEQLPNITKKIVIDGKKAITIDGGSKSGRLDGIFIVASGELNLIKLKLQYGQRPFGGAIWVKGAGSARVTEVEFYRNLADNGVGNGDGGAVAVDAGAFYCVKSKFQENTARNAGGAISSGGVQVLLDRCEFLRNHAEVNGGAYAGFGGSEVTHPIIRESKFRENWVHPAVVPQNWPGQYQFTDDQSGGGAIYNQGFMEIEHSEIFKNYTQKSKGGGAIYNQGDLRLHEVAISDNKARPDSAVPNTLGGAILNDSTLIMLRTSIHGNEARFGGAIMNRTGGRLYVVNSTVADNLATSGGGIENGHNFVMNGAPAINNGGEVNIWHSTVVRANDNNSESTSIGNIQNGSVYMANSVIDSRCTGTIYTWGGNLFKQFCQRFSADSGVDKSNSDVLVQNVGQIGLEGLTNNGGPNLPEA